MREFVAWANQLGQMLEGVKDVQSAEAAAKQLETATESGRNLFARSMQVTATIDPAEMQALQREIQPEIARSMSKVYSERYRIYAVPALKAIIAPKLDAALNEVSRPAVSVPPTSQPATKAHLDFAVSAVTLQVRGHLQIALRLTGR